MKVLQFIVTVHLGRVGPNGACYDTTRRGNVSEWRVTRVSVFYMYLLHQTGYIMEQPTISSSIREFFFFTGAKTRRGSWPPPWHFLLRLRNCEFFRSGFVCPTSNPQPGGPGTSLRLTLTLWLVWQWVELPGFYAPASIALQVIAELKPLLHDKATVLKEATCNGRYYWTFIFTVMTLNVDFSLGPLLRVDVSSVAYSELRAFSMDIDPETSESRGHWWYARGAEALWCRDERINGRVYIILFVHGCMYVVWVFTYVICTMYLCSVCIHICIYVPTYVCVHEVIYGELVNCGTRLISRWIECVAPRDGVIHGTASMSYSSTASCEVKIYFEL
jgi:hypothetical protein